MTVSLGCVRRLEMFVMFIFILVRQTHCEYFKRQWLDFKICLANTVYIIVISVGKPSIAPLETLHNALSLRQLDSFLEKTINCPSHPEPEHPISRRKFKPQGKKGKASHTPI